jgi:CDP-4-dehydro-6-deoxyglucose reductase
MSFRIDLRPGEDHFEADPDESVLEAALRNGLNLPHSCRGGSCLSCQATLVSGDVDYPKGRPSALSDEDVRENKVLLCQAHALGDLIVEAKPIEMVANIRIRRLPCRVTRLEKLCHDVMAMHIKLPSIEPFEYLPGQYLDILLLGGERRSFSIANPPHDAGLIELHVRRVAGGTFTAKVFDEMKERTLLRVEGPLGQFYLREDSDRPLLMVAGGTGFAPIKAILRHLMHSGSARPVHFYWGVRSLADLYEAERVEEWLRDCPWLSFTAVLSEPQAADQWQGRTGFVHEVVTADHSELSGFDIYVCGPPPMIESARRDFAAIGALDERLFFDSFEFASVSTT